MKDKIKIILVDDDVELLNNLKIILEENNFNVICMAKDGMEALDLIFNNNSDFVIIDNQMPKLNGIDVIKKVIENKSSRSQFILFTGELSDEIIQECITLNVKCFAKTSNYNDIIEYMNYSFEDDNLENIKKDNIQNVKKKTFFKNILTKFKK